MENNYLERRADALKSETSDVISDLINEIEELELAKNNLEVQISKLEDDLIEKENEISSLESQLIEVKECYEGNR